MNVHIDPASQHAVYAPSGAKVWTKCTASATAVAAMGRVIKSENSEESESGTAAHDEIERVLGPLNSVPIVCDYDFIANTEVIDEDHAAAFGISLFVNFAHKLSVATPGRFFIEQRVRLTDQIWGRLDMGHWHAESATVTIVDYKNGFVGVDAEENEQFRIYAAALIRQHKLPAKWVRYVCVQPNDFRPVPHVKQWIESVESLFRFADRVAAIPDSSLEFKFGSHCRDCPLFGTCEPTKDILAQFATVIATGAECTSAQIPLFIACKKPIDHFFESIMKVGTKRGLAGDVPPGMKIVTASKHRVWKNEASARAAVIAAKGVDALKPPTPAQAEDMGINIDGLADKPPGGPALAFESDKRPIWAPRTSAEMFAGIPGVTGSHAGVK